MFTDQVLQNTFGLKWLNSVVSRYVELIVVSAVLVITLV